MEAVVVEEGSIALLEPPPEAALVSDVAGPGEERGADSDDVDSHSKTGQLKLHHSLTDANGEFVKQDEFIDTSDEPDHDGLCRLEQEYLLKAIKEDLDLSQHMKDAVVYVAKQPVNIVKKPVKYAKKPMKLAKKGIKKVLKSNNSGGLSRPTPAEDQGAQHQLPI